jgi:hypothetical protein
VLGSRPNLASIMVQVMHDATGGVEDHRRTVRRKSLSCREGRALGRRQPDQSRLRFVQPVSGHRLGINVGLIAPRLCKIVGLLQP